MPGSCTASLQMVVTTAPDTLNQDSLCHLPPNQPNVMPAKAGFDKIQRRFDLNSEFLHGYTTSGDRHASEENVSVTFKTIVDKGEYSCEQVFNAAETGLFWKLM